MMQDSHTGAIGRASYLAPSELPGAGQHPDKMQGHWVLARVGKRVLRPGGIELTWQMLDTLAIGPQDRVVEFAPGLGVTAKMVLQKHPRAYWGVEREPSAAHQLQQRFAGPSTQIVQASAEQSGLPDACASVVYSEALLSMQTPQQKNRIVAEACRLLAAGGRYGIHELCLLPNDIPDSLRQEIQAAMSRDIHVGVQPLCRDEWIRLFRQNGLKVTWSGEAPMHLLEPRRLLQDEGLMGSLRIAFRVATRPELGSRFRSMRRLFAQYGEHLGAISLVGEREQVIA
ncbi:MAG: class I SAM-dependent methyltransferase [Acidobacteriales bacterium]|nr:class I SAM-dependent methyltransferase [Terriglobales bacterium]